MAPFVEMLPTNFFPDEPPSADPELDPDAELDPDPELEPELEDDAPDEVAPEEAEEPPPEDELDPELIPPPDPELELKDETEPEPDDDVLEDESPSVLEPDPLPPPPPSSLDHWFEPAELPHAIPPDARATNKRRLGRGARFIEEGSGGPKRNPSVKRHPENLGMPGDGFPRTQPLLGSD